MPHHKTRTQTQGYRHQRRLYRHLHSPHKTQRQRNQQQHPNAIQFSIPRSSTQHHKKILHRHLPILPPQRHKRSIQTQTHRHPNSNSTDHSIPHRNHHERKIWPSPPAIQLRSRNKRRHGLHHQSHATINRTKHHHTTTRTQTSHPSGTIHGPHQHVQPSLPTRTIRHHSNRLPRTNTPHQPHIRHTSIRPLQMESKQMENHLNERRRQPRMPPLLHICRTRHEQSSTTTRQTPTTTSS